MKRKYTKAQMRTIKLSLRDGLSAKKTADRVNALKSTQKSGDNVTTQAITAAFRRCEKENW